MATTKKARPANPVKKARPASVKNKVEKVTTDIDGTITKVPAAVARKAKRFLELKDEERSIKQELANLQAELIDFLDTEGHEKMIVDSKTYKRVQGEKVVTDEEKLKKLIGATTFNKLTVRVMDKEKLDEAVKAGTVTVAQVAQASEIKKNRPYISTSK